MDILIVVVFITFLSFALVAFRGAPYVPTHGRDVTQAIEMLKTDKKGTIVDLGSGDGTLLIAAAKQGYKAVGYELNPFLVALTWLRTRRYKNKVRVRLSDFWRTPLPNDTTAVFVFLAQPYMKKLEQHLNKEAKRLGHPIVLVSYAFDLPGQKAERKQGALLKYTIKP